MDEDVINAANVLWLLAHNNHKCCQFCYTYDTPLWRKYKYYGLLCNRCGLKIKMFYTKNK
jgi:hypothetical protein